MKQSITFLCVVCAALSSACINGAPKEILDVLIVGGILAEPLKVTVEAGPDMNVGAGDIVTLSGRAKASRESPELVFEWIQTGGPVVKLQVVGIETASFVAPAFNNEYSMSFEFRAQLAGRDLREDSVIVLVKPASIPE